jgi:hypothetical protein
MTIMEVITEYTKLCGLGPQSELYRLSDRGLSAKLVPTFEDRRCRVVGVMDPYGRILGFLNWSRYFFFQAVPRL